MRTSDTTPSFANAGARGCSIWQMPRERRGWSAAGIKPSPDHLTLFNSLSIARREAVGVEVQEGVSAVLADGRELPCQVVQEDGKEKLYFVTPDVPGFSSRRFTCSISGASFRLAFCRRIASWKFTPRYQTGLRSPSRDAGRTRISLLSTAH